MCHSLEKLPSFKGRNLLMYKDMIDHRSYVHNLHSCETQASGLNGIRTHDLCDTSAVA